MRWRRYVRNIIFVGLADKELKELEKGCSCQEAWFNQFTEDETYSICMAEHAENRDQRPRNLNQ